MWAKQRFYELGISPNEFKRCKIRDIKDVIDIKSEIELKIQREQEVQDLINKTK